MVASFLFIKTGFHVVVMSILVKKSKPTIGT